MPTVPLGILNALVNLGIWIITALCAFATEKIYKKVASYELEKTGVTRATDASEVSPTSWIFAKQIGRRKRPVWWILILLLLNFSLLPLEILLEAGINEDRQCEPKTNTSIGICASPWQGHSEVGISSAALLTQRFDWVDKEWDFVLEGSDKSANAQEVRVNRNLLDANRKFLIRECKVQTGFCRENDCGHFTILRDLSSPYDTIVSNWSLLPPNLNPVTDYRGDITYDKFTGLGFIFYDGGSKNISKRRAYNTSKISVLGVETVLNKLEIKKILNADTDPWNISLEFERTRTYKITCFTDGFTSKNLVRAVSLFRTTQMEQPGVHRKNVNEIIEKVDPLTTSDVVMAAFSMKAEDWNDECAGEIELYQKCGKFDRRNILPFLILAAVIIFIWISIYVVVQKAYADVPIDARGWRKHALDAIRLHDLGSQRDENNLEALSFDDDSTMSHDDVFRVHMLTNKMQERRKSGVSSETLGVSG